MASFNKHLLHLLHLLLLISAASAWSRNMYYRWYGGSFTFTPKQQSDGTYEVELRNKQATFLCNENWYMCSSGNCGYQTRSDRASIGSNSYGLRWCQNEVITTRKINGNLPFEIRYPKEVNRYYGKGYWVSNVRNSWGYSRMMAHVDLGTRSDTGESNRSPITNMLPIIRVPRNCQRSINLTVFDPDGDHVRCRVPTSSSSFECGLCGLTNSISFDQNSCSLTYRWTGQIGYQPIELVVEDFAKEHIKLSYHDGSYTVKNPLSVVRRKRQSSFTDSAPTTTAAPTTTTAYPTTTTAYPTTTTAYPTTTTAYPTTTTAAPTTTTAYPTTTTAYPTTTTASPTTTTAYPTTTTAAPTTTTAYPTTTTAYPTTTTAAPTTTTASPTTTTAYPTTTTASPTTTTASPTTTTASPTTTTAYPTTTTAAPTTTTAAPTTTTVAPTTTTAAPTTTTAAPTTTTPASPTTTGSLYRKTIEPLSKIPLQFSIHVDNWDAPSCIDGDYFPIFVSPTPKNGENLPAFVNKTLEINVRSKAQYITYFDLLVTGPKGISKHRTAAGEYTIKWTPTENELNDHFAICFVSEGRISSYVFHSEPRCVIIDVGHHDATVTCNETTITVEVEKTYLIRRNEERLHLNNFKDSSCNLSTLSNSTHLVAVMSLNTCGTLVEEDDDNIIFKNQITSADPDYIISRKNEVEIAFLCAYPKRTNLTLEFRHKNPYAFTERGFGAFTFQFEFFESKRFRKQVDSSTYPVEVYLKQTMFMQIEASTSIPNTEIFVESCRATPYDNPNSRISYTIIEQGCVRDNTVQIYPSSKTQFRFSMDAFEFIGAHEEVYITCTVLLCETGVAGTRCSRGCIKSNSGNQRGKREAVAQTSSHFISQGPLRLGKTSDSQASGPSLNLGMNLVFIVGCLLACGVVIYRSRRSKAKYQPLPTFDSDTD